MKCNNAAITDINMHYLIAGYIYSCFHMPSPIKNRWKTGTQMNSYIFYIAMSAFSWFENPVLSVKLRKISMQVLVEILSSY